MIANPNDGNSPRVEVATPMIDVSAGGLITAKTEQEKGYVPGGTKSATQQLTTQGTQLVTPGTEQISIGAPGSYMTGAIYILGDENLIPENIAEGVSIFGVQGTHSGGGDICRIQFVCKPSGKAFVVFFLDANGEFVSTVVPGGTPDMFFQVKVGTLITMSHNPSIGTLSFSENVTHHYSYQAGLASYFSVNRPAEATYIQLEVST